MDDLYLMCICICICTCIGICICIANDTFLGPLRRLLGAKNRNFGFAFPHPLEWGRLILLIVTSLPPPPPPLYPTDSAAVSLSVPPVVPPIPDRFCPSVPECPSSRPPIPDRFSPRNPGVRPVGPYTRQILPQCPEESLQSSSLHPRA